MWSFVLCTSTHLSARRFYHQCVGAKECTISGEADVTITECNGMSPRWMTSFGVHDVMISLLHHCGAERLIILVNAGRMKSAPETKGGPQRSLSPCFLWQVRGAPAIAIVGCLSLAVELRAGAGGDDPVTFIRESLCHLTSARPTAVNMGRAARELMEFAENESMEKNSEQLRERWGGATRWSCIHLKCYWF